MKKIVAIILTTVMIFGINVPLSIADSNTGIAYYYRLTITNASTNQITSSANEGDFIDVAVEVIQKGFTGSYSIESLDLTFSLPDEFVLGNENVGSGSVKTNKDCIVNYDYDDIFISYLRESNPKALRFNYTGIISGESIEIDRQIFSLGVFRLKAVDNIDNISFDSPTRYVRLVNEGLDDGHDIQKLKCVHEYDDSVVTVPPSSTLPGINVEGTHTGTCSVCGETVTEDCTFENCVCTKCGAIQAFDVTLNNYDEDGIVVTGISTGKYGGTVTFTVASDNACVVFTGTGDDLQVIPSESVDGSGAHSYSVNVNSDKTISIYYKGDTDCNGELSLPDVNAVMSHCKGNTELSPMAQILGDVDGSQGIDMMDVDKLIKAVYGVETIDW